MVRSSRLLILVCAVVLLGVVRPDAAPGAGKPGRAAEGPYAGYESAIYADPAHWLCRPDADDVCDHDLDATVVRASGRTKVRRWRAARKPKIDCFYVYPTISTDQAGNSDLVPGDDQERFVVRQQAARLGSVCRVFAPGGDLTPEWGLHLVDASVAMGDLVAIAKRQAGAYAKRRR